MTDQLRPKTTIVVPCFMEARRLLPEKLLELTEPPSHTLLFVDDGSTDETLAVVRGVEAKHPKKVKVLALPRNRGKGEAVRLGLLEAIAHGAQIVGYYDADLATPPAEMIRLIGHVTNGGPRFAMASRVALLGRQIERSPVRHYLGRIFASAASLALAMRVYDTQCGAKAIAVDEALRAALAEPFTSRWVFDVELIVRLTTRGGWGTTDFVEMPLREWRDIGGSKLSQRAMAGAVRDLLRLGWTARKHRAAM